MVRILDLAHLHRSRGQTNFAASPSDGKVLYLDYLTWFLSRTSQIRSGSKVNVTLKDALPPWLACSSPETACSILPGIELYNAVSNAKSFFSEPHINQFPQQKTLHTFSICVTQLFLLLSQPLLSTESQLNGFLNKEQLSHFFNQPQRRYHA
jgi:hypothetical protein